jgi:hypothetical protein
MTKHQHQSEPEPTVAEAVPSDTRVIEEFPKAMFKAASTPPVVEVPVPVILHAVAQTAEEQAALEADGYHADQAAAVAHTDGAAVASPKQAEEPRRYRSERE